LRKNARKGIDRAPRRVWDDEVNRPRWILCKRRLRKEFLDETAVDSLEEDAVVLSLFLA